MSQVVETSLESGIGHLAGVICNERFPTGERAALRRMAPRQGLPWPVSFYRFALMHLPDNWERHAEDWVTIVAGIAIMAPNAHRFDRGVGKALAEAGYSEARLERLLAATGHTQRTLVLRAARSASKASPCNWWTRAALAHSGWRKKRTAQSAYSQDFYQNYETR